MARRSCRSKDLNCGQNPTFPNATAQRSTRYSVLAPTQNRMPRTECFSTPNGFEGPTSKLERIGWGCALPQFLVEETLLDEMEPVWLER